MDKTTDLMMHSGKHCESQRTPPALGAYPVETTSAWKVEVDPVVTAPAWADQLERVNETTLVPTGMRHEAAMILSQIGEKGWQRETLKVVAKCL